MEAATFCEELEHLLWKMEDVVWVGAHTHETAMTVQLKDDSEFEVQVSDVRV